jgi:uncharacterized protein
MQADAVDAKFRGGDNARPDALNGVPRAKIAAAIAAALLPFIAGRLWFAGWTLAGDWLAAARAGILILLELGALAYVVRAEHVPPRAIGLRTPRASTLAWGVAGFVVLVAASVVLTTAAAQLGVKQDSRVLEALASRPLWLMLLVAATAGLTEELAFRGILIGHIGALARRPWVGAFASVLLFSALHVNGNWIQFFFVLPSAVILTGLYLWRRDLVACMIAHALTDMLGLLLQSAHVR